MDWETILFVIFVGAAIFMFARWLLFGKRCPACQKTHAMKKTGQVDKRGFFKSDLYEYKCKFCGHTIWEKESSGGGGGDDDGWGDEGADGG